MRRRTFQLSLIELLVVLTIICILAGLLIPMIDGVLTASRRTSCMNNLRNISQLWMTWAEGNKFRSPAGESSPLCVRAQDASGVTWVDHLKKEGETSDDLFVCPEQSGGAAAKYGYGLNPLAGASWNYLKGSFGPGFKLTPEEKRACLLSMIINPGKTVMFSDSGPIKQERRYSNCTEWEEDTTKEWKPYTAFKLTSTTISLRAVAPDNGYDWGNTCRDSGVGKMGWDQCYRALSRHRGTNCLMADGSVSTTPLPELVEAEWGSPSCMFDNQPTH